ncbi:MAG TPA: 50S ribosomal protein L13 [Thermoplasmata archaeon]|nr:50S ribosomal protein L13 [Thermoplasmata archaeon]
MPDSESSPPATPAATAAEKKPRAPKITKTPAKPAAAPSAAPKAKPATTPTSQPAAKPSSGSAPKLTLKPAHPAKLANATVVDASDLILGRAASQIAKRLLKGESIVVINAEKSVVTGGRAMVLDFYIANRARGSKRMGPHYPRYPDRIFRRTVRGMLPHLKTRGKVAFERLEVFIGVPAEYAGAPHQSIDLAKARPALRPPTTLEEISRLLGARL